MRIQNKHYHTIWTDAGKVASVMIIDQTRLPFTFHVHELFSFRDAFTAVRDMQVRGAPLIGVTAAYGIWLGLMEMKHNGDLAGNIAGLCSMMKAARPTAVNPALSLYRLQLLLEQCKDLRTAQKTAFSFAEALKRNEINACEAIGDYGLPLIREIADRKNGKPVNILTHCNAGWLACVDWGTATAPVYKAHREGIPVHVWVDETRPRLQGSRLTAFELREEGIPHTVITDNAGGHLMQKGMVDMVLTGSDRTTRRGDVCNKIGTYLKALAAFDNQIPFYVAVPVSSIDMNIRDDSREIPIEERAESEVVFIEGKEGKMRILAEGSPVANFGFDVTPSRLVTGLITEYGICGAEEKEIVRLLKHDKDPR